MESKSFPVHYFFGGLGVLLLLWTGSRLLDLWTYRNAAYAMGDVSKCEQPPRCFYDDVTFMAKDKREIHFRVGENTLLWRNSDARLPVMYLPEDPEGTATVATDAITAGTNSILLLLGLACTGIFYWLRNIKEIK